MCILNLKILHQATTHVYTFCLPDITACYTTSRKSMNKRREFFASRRIQTFNFLCTDARTHARTQTDGWHSIDCFQNPAHKLTALITSVSLGDLAWFLDMFYWVVLAVQWSLSRVDSLHLTSDKYCRKLDFMMEGSQTHTDTHRCTQRIQMHADEGSQMQTNARQTASGVWPDTTSRRIQTLDVCSRTFGTYYTRSPRFYLCICILEAIKYSLIPRPLRFYHAAVEKN